MYESKNAQRFGGFMALTLGSVLLAWTWHSALTGEGFYIKAALIAPFLVVFGIGMMLFPMDMESLREEHGVPKPDKLRFAHYPIHWKILTVVAFIAGFANWAVLAWN